MAMLSWQDMGLVRGHHGSDFSPVTVTCPHCGSHGVFNRAFRGLSRESEPGTELYSDVWQCQECANFIFVLWRTEEGFVDYRVFPYRGRQATKKRSWPELAANAYEEAVSSLFTEDWDGAVVMAKHAMDTAIQDCGEVEGELLEQLQALGEEGAITRSLVQWAKGIPSLNSEKGGNNPTGEEAKEAVRFTRYLLDLLYSLPYDAERYHRG